MNLCDYCKEREGKYKMTSGKWCCESFYTKCPNIRNKISIRTKEGMNNNEVRKKISEANTGKPGYWLGKKRYKKTCEKVSKAQKERFKNPLERVSKLTKIGMKKSNASKKISIKLKEYYSDLVVKKNVSKRMKILWKDKRYREKMTNDNASNWKGGKYSYCHYKAKELFGKDKYEICGINENESLEKSNKRLSMHCRNGIYNILEEWNWITVCEFGCHQKIERIDNPR